jgi:type II secretory pathway component GspD/PulD (secretin)
MTTEISRGLALGKSRPAILAGLLVLALCAPASVAQDIGNAMPPVAQVSTSEVVTINENDGNIVQVLNAFSIQTGRSIVVGPEVTGKVNVRLNHVRWDDALNVILKPSGFGYYLVGDTVIVCSTDKIPKGSGSQTIALSEPLITRVLR